MTNFGKNCCQPICSRYSMLDFFSSALCCMSLKNSLCTHVTHTRTHTRTHTHTQLGSLIWVEMTSNDLQSLNLNGITLTTSFWFSTELERPASPRHICAVTRGFQTTTQDVSVFRFLPRHYHMTRVLLSPFITTVCTPVVLAIINII